jgi:hypothetical protein
VWLTRFDKANRDYIVIGFFVGLFSLVLAVESPYNFFAAAGCTFLMAGFLSTALLYRRLQYGTFMHFVPYTALLIGTALLLMAPGVRDIWNPLGMGLVAFALTALLHAIVLYERRTSPPA